MPRGYQLAQQGQAIGPQPGQHYSGYPPQVGYGTNNAHHPYHPHAYHPEAYQPQAHYPQAHHPEAYHPQAHYPQAHHPEAYQPQAHYPQAHHPQAYQPQAHYPQAHHPKAYHPQAYYPQVHHPQLAIPQATILSPQPGVPEPGAQQPNIPQAKTPHAHVPQAAIPPPPVKFEEKLSYFRPVPDPRPEDAPRPGPGRKKKYQRFWAPLGASDELKMHYQSLQTCDERVNGAEKKLAENKEPSQAEHLQKIVLRNMQKREDAWVECDRIESGLVAVPLDLEEAGPRAKERYQAWCDLRDRVQIREQSLRMRYGLADDAIIDTTQLRKEDRQGLQTMVNWRENKWRSLLKSLSTLQDALNRTYPPPPEGGAERLKLIHGLGVYPAWSSWIWPGDSPQDVAQRQRYADPDPSTWDASEPAAEYPHANLGNGEEVDRMAGIVAQPAQYQQQPQIPQDDVSAENQEGLVSFSIEEAEAEIEAFNREGPIVFEESPQQLRDIEDGELLAPIAAYNRQHDQLQTQEAPVDEEMTGMHVTHEEGLGLIQDFFQDNQPGQPQQQLEEGAIVDTIEEMERQGLVMTDAEIADTLGTFGPNGEYLPPQGQAATEDEGNEVSAGSQGEQPEQQQGQQASDSNNDEAESGGSTLSNGPKTGFRIPVDWFTMQEVHKFAREDFEAWEQARGTQVRAA